MNQDLSFWRKLILDFTDKPKTDADIRYIYKDLVRPEIPATALWDAENGAIKRFYNTGLDSLTLDDIRKTAIKNRGWGIDQKPEDMPYKTPTGRIMEQLLNPDKIIVPDKNKMDDIWQ